MYLNVMLKQKVQGKLSEMIIMIIVKDAIKENEEVDKIDVPFRIMLFMLLLV